MIRSRRFNFRPLFIALVAVAVFASPVLSAEACARACAAAHHDAVPSVEKQCCAAKHAEHRSTKQQQPKKSEQRDKDCGGCVSACCRTVTATDEHHAPVIGETLALSVEIAPVAAREFVSHNLIFHPPRV